MAKKEKMSKTEIIDKSIKTVEYLIVPAAGVAAIWGWEIGIYVSSFAGILLSILTFIKLFIK